MRSVFDRDGVALPDRYSRLERLGLSAALTTTFDTLLERIFFRSPDSVLTPKDTEQLLAALSAKDFFIGKLYGRLTDPDSVMLSPSQYEEVVARNEGLGQFMESLFVSRTLLFLGCSLKGIQDYLGGLRIKGANRRHYALVAVAGAVWETKAEYLLDRYGIQVIPVPEDQGQETVDAFINDLADAIASRREQTNEPDPLRPAGTTLRDGSPGLIREIHLRNIGLFTDLRLELDPHWNVLLGDNGVGKSTVLKAIALAFCGRDGRDYAERLLAAGQTSGQISVRTDRQEYVTNLSRTRSGVEVTSLPDRPLEIEGWLALGFPALRTLTWRAARVGSDDEGRGRPVSQDLTPLLCGDPDPRLDEVKDWIVSLDYWMRRGGADPERIQDFREGLFELLGDVTRTPGLHFDRVDKESNRVMVAADGLSLPIEAMSQGTASLLGWLGVLVRRLFQVAGGVPGSLDRPALVLIDELDAHMHPGWQQVLVSRLKERFPRVQFIATTHSPLVVAGLDAGQVVRFRRLDGKGVVAERPPHGLKGVGVAGLLTSDLFSLSSQLDPETEAQLTRKRELAALDDLGPEEAQELADLDERLGRVDFTTVVRDPLYPQFVRAMSELRLAETSADGDVAPPQDSPEQRERQRDLARQVLKDLLAQEETPGQGEAQ
ncbi:AAA family ATPase [uncultured Thiodictyon sp.]|uniref:AAA family ATPase n=1 Tax=uncultured Thiodictyon sp. TaxID=1846217 RepID=UPI0026015661|nr:AAA family ATPase [uncultured Thiodictyon sp.]